MCVAWHVGILPQYRQYSRDKCVRVSRTHNNMKITHTNHDTEIDQFIRILLLTKCHVTAYDEMHVVRACAAYICALQQRGALPCAVGVRDTRDL